MSNELYAKIERAATNKDCGSFSLAEWQSSLEISEKCSLCHLKLSVPQGKIAVQLSLFAGPRKQPTPCIFSTTSDSKTGRQQWISVDDGGNSIGLWRGWKTSADGGRRGMPKGE